MGRLLKRWSLLHVHHVSDAFDLLEVRPFMASQPLCVRVHGPYEWLTRPVTVAVRDQSLGFNGSNTFKRAVRCLAKERSEGWNSCWG
jgi:hypothetical protein